MLSMLSAFVIFLENMLARYKFTYQRMFKKIIFSLNQGLLTKFHFDCLM